MRRAKVWRYYCDFCKRAGCSGGHIRTHEAHCCRNPNRVCRMCVRLDAEQQPLPTLVDALNSGGIERLRDVANYCPACMLTAVMAVNASTSNEDDWVHFEYAAEARAVWDNIDAANAAAGPF